MSKKILISALLIGILAFGAGLGTFAYFTAQATSTENVYEVGTFLLSKGSGAGSTSVDLGKIFESENMQPGVETKVKKFTLTNKGTLEMKLNAQINWEAKQDRDINGANIPDVYYKTSKGTFENLDAEGKVYVDMFQVKPMLKVNDTEYVASNEWVNVTKFENWLNGKINKKFNPNDILELEFQLRLSPDAGNKYQGSSIKADMTINASQTNIPKAEPISPPEDTPEV